MDLFEIPRAGFLTSFAAPSNMAAVTFWVKEAKTNRIERIDLTSVSDSV